MDRSLLTERLEKFNGYVIYTLLDRWNFKIEERNRADFFAIGIHSSWREEIDNGEK